MDTNIGIFHHILSETQCLLSDSIYVHGDLRDIYHQGIICLLWKYLCVETAHYLLILGLFFFASHFFYKFLQKVKDFYGKNLTAARAQIFIYIFDKW